MGVDVTIAGSKDGFKNIDIDINLYPSKYYSRASIFDRILKQITVMYRTRKFKDFDVVQFISATKFFNRVPYIGYFYNKIIYNSILKNNKNVFLVSCGSDPVYSQIGLNYLDYQTINKNIASIHPKVKNLKALNWNIELAQRVKGIIPISYEYLIGYKNLNNKNINISECIPLPVDTDRFSYSRNIVNNKIVILHGISRPEFKGSKHILNAMEKIHKLYPDRVEIKSVTRLSLEEYIKQVRDCNVLIDQCNSYGYGMNTLIGLAFGKIVLSGAEKEHVDSLQLNNCPVFNIKPDEHQIIKQLQKIIFNIDIEQKGWESRQFVENVHDSKIIAEKYLEYWKLYSD